MADPDFPGLVATAPGIKSADIVLTETRVANLRTWVASAFGTGATTVASVNSAYVWTMMVFARMMMDHRYETARAAIRWEVIPRFGDMGVADIRAKLFKGIGAGETYYSTGSTISKLLDGVKLQVTMTTKWPNFNFDGMVYHLAAWLGVSLNRERLDVRQLVGGDVSAFGVNTPDGLDQPGQNAVFISKNVTTACNVPIAAVLIAAANCCGATVYSDIVPVAAGARSTISMPTGSDFLYACSFALSMLQYMYDQAGVGDAFSLAFFSGLHNSVSVVAHSDEGGLTRDVLRHTEFSKPRGGIPPNVPLSSGLLGLPRYCGLSDVCTWVSTYAILSAAAVAHCAPLVTWGGKAHPPLIDVGVNTNAFSRMNAQLVSFEVAFRRFAPAYIRALVCLAGSAGISVWDEASDTLSDACLRFRTATMSKMREASRRVDEHNLNEAGKLAQDPSYVQQLKTFDPRNVCRHIAKGDIWAPFFWVEPTGVLPRHAFDTSAEKLGLASLGCAIDPVFEVPYVRSPTFLPTVSNETMRFNFPYDSARRTGFMLWEGIAQTGTLAHSKIMAVHPDSLYLLKTSDNYRDAISGGTDCNILRWGHGQSFLPHPSEAGYVGAGMTLKMRYQTFDDNDCCEPIRYMPTPHDVAESRVIMRFGTVSFARTGRPGRENRFEVRLRSQASELIANATQFEALVGTPPRVRDVVQIVDPYLYTPFESVQGSVQTALCRGEVAPPGWAAATTLLTAPLPAAELLTIPLKPALPAMLHAARAGPTEGTAPAGGAGGRGPALPPVAPRAVQPAAGQRQVNQQVGATGGDGGPQAIGGGADGGGQVRAAAQVAAGGAQAVVQALPGAAP